MADAHRFQSGAGIFAFQRRTTSPQRRQHFSTDTPSPTPSPHNPTTGSSGFNMYNHAHNTQHAMMNGGQNHQRFGMQQMKYQPSHQSQPHQPHHHGNQNTHAGHLGHQYNNSSGALNSANSHYASGHVPNGSAEDDRPMTEFGQQQLQLLAECRGAASPNHHAKARGHQNGPTYNIPNGVKEDSQQEERHRASSISVVKKGEWVDLDMGGQGLRALSDALFRFNHLQKLYINHNQLDHLPSAIGSLRGLIHLDLTRNQLVELPSEIGMLTNLKTLYLFDNQLRQLPDEFGYLYRLETLGLEGNHAIDPDTRDLLWEKGTKELVRYFREKMPPPDPPPERDMIIIDETTSANQVPDKVSALSFNILCEKYATRNMYAYVPDRIINWEYRRDLIMEEIHKRDPDVICFQELDKQNHDEWFRPNLSVEGYKGYYAQKSRADTMSGAEARMVDGCGTFWREKKYICLDQAHLIFGRKAVEREGKKTADMINRVWQRDDIAVVNFLENRTTGSRLIVVNAHIFWNPEFRDVQLIQVAVLLEELTKLADKWAKEPSCTKKTPFRFSNDPAAEPEPVGPSQEYAHGSQIPMLICGDFNSSVDSTVYNLLTSGDLAKGHTDFQARDYGHYSNSGISHYFTLKSAYSAIGELEYTNYTPDFNGALDYIFYSSNALRLTSLLGEIDRKYLAKVPGFPNFHFPSDHIALFAEFAVVPKKGNKVVEVDFGGGSASGSGSARRSAA